MSGTALEQEECCRSILRANRFVQRSTTDSILGVAVNVSFEQQLNAPCLSFAGTLFCSQHRPDMEILCISAIDLDTLPLYC